MFWLAAAASCSEIADATSSESMTATCPGGGYGGIGGGYGGNGADAFTAMSSFAHEPKLSQNLRVGQSTQ